MSPLDPEQAQQLARQRAAMGRARAQGRRWYLRSVLMAAIAAVALYRGGQINTVVGVVMAFLALLAWSLGRSLRRSATDMETKIKLMENT
ncbi:MAG: hypothetical protein ACHQX4_09955 [Gemmatimonadales bacterium]